MSKSGRIPESLSKSQVVVRTSLFLSAAIFFLCIPSTAWSWDIASFHSDIAVQQDGSLIVEEKIEADFQGEPHHGIYRDIPFITQDRHGVRRSLRITFLGAKNEESHPWQTQLTRHGAYQRFRFGSADVTYTTRETFDFTYRVERILGSFPDHDELYWNVTGNDWAVPILHAAATVRLPHPVVLGELTTEATTGLYGSSAHDVEIESRNNSLCTYEVTRSLNPFEGLTIVVGWPQGLISRPRLAARIGWFFHDNWLFGVPMIVFFSMAGIWWRFGRDIGRGSITVQYEPPPDLTPAEMGTLVGDAVTLREITATIVDLARRGYLTIEQISESDYHLRLTRPPEHINSQKLKDHESIILQGLFSDGNDKRLSDLEYKFYSRVPSIETKLYENLTRGGYWVARPDIVRWIWWGVAILCACIGVLTAQLFGEDPTLFLFSFLVTAGIIAVFAPFMPRKTWAGVRTLDHILGLKEFLSRTDQDRLRRESDLGSLFERMLPCAMVLGVAHQWAHAFEGIYQIRPVWYASYNGRVFSPSNFGTRIQSMSDRMGTVLSSPPRSSGGSGFGGGFSGGGGGGGGGGAW